MAQETIKSVVEMLDERPPVDNLPVFHQLYDISLELRKKIEARFELHPDASVKDFQPYHGLPGTGATGSQFTFSGPEIDWFVHSWIGNPQHGFCNIHITVWLGPHIRAPHFGLAIATVPDMFFYMDYIPRVDLMTDLAYLDRYYEPLNERYLEIRKRPELAYFTSKSLYVRQALSETAVCYTCPPSDERIAFVRSLAHEMLDRWLKWVDDAEPVPVEERAALAARDLAIRRNIAERDPANIVGERLFGKELTDRLVRNLWGGDRVLPRPGLG
jgi:hypothetical protein